MSPTQGIGSDTVPFSMQPLIPQYVPWTGITAHMDLHSRPADPAVFGDPPLDAFCCDKLQVLVQPNHMNTVSLARTLMLAPARLLLLIVDCSLMQLFPLEHILSHSFMMLSPSMPGRDSFL
jgi:hypothetical protein